MSGRSEAARVRRRYLALTAMRWLPNGLMVPVFPLVFIDRGFTLGEIGAAFADMAITVFALELPTGGLADALGRRPVLIAATLLDVLALSLFVAAESVMVLAIASLLTGVYRALESGPLDAWLIDELAAVEIDGLAAVEIDGLAAIDGQPGVASVLGAGGVASGLATACGALASAGLVGFGPVGGVEVLVFPLAVAAVIRLVGAVVLGVLMRETRERSSPGGVYGSVRAVPGIVTSTLRTVRASTVLTALIGVELLWGFGMVTFETLVPVRLAELLDGTERAATWFGPAATAAWLASAIGAWAATRCARRVGTARAAMLLQGLQAATVVAMAVLAGPIVVIGFYLLTLGAHGGLNPLYKTLLNAQADSSNRTTMMSAASMAGFPGFAVGGIVLGAIADRGSTSIAMAVGAGALAAAMLLYLPADRQGGRGAPQVSAAAKSNARHLTA